MNASWHAGKKCLSKSESFACAPTPDFHRSHNIGRTLTPKKPQRPKSAMDLSISNGRTSPLRTFYSRTDSPFISSPAVPKTHMPSEALKLQDMRGWSCTQKPREWSIWYGKTGWCVWPVLEVSVSILTPSFVLTPLIDTTLNSVYQGDLFNT